MSHPHVGVFHLPSCSWELGGGGLCTGAQGRKAAFPQRGRSLLSKHYGDFPGGPVVETLPSSSQGAGLILVGELKCHIPQGVAKNFKDKQSTLDTSFPLWSLRQTNSTSRTVLESVPSSPKPRPWPRTSSALVWTVGASQPPSPASPLTSSNPLQGRAGSTYALKGGWTPLVTNEYI